MTSGIRIALLLLQVVAVAIGIWVGNVVWQAVS